MSRPEVDLKIYKENKLYDWYRKYRPNKAAALAEYGALAIAFAPKVTFADGARERISHHFDNGRHILLASKHGSEYDPCRLASAAVRNTVLWPLVANSFIPSKSTISKYPI